MPAMNELRAAVANAATEEAKAHALQQLLAHAGYLYYVKDAPEMEDYEYDKLYRELLDLVNGASRIYHILFTDTARRRQD